MSVQKLTISSETGQSIALGHSDIQSFSEIFQRHYAALCLFAERMVGNHAEDVVEEFFLSLWNTPHDFESDEHLRAFLYRSVKNACLNFLKISLRTNERNTKYAIVQGQIENSYLTEITRTEIIRELHQAISELPPQCSKIISMGYIDGMSNSEIAEKLGLSLQTVKNQKLRGLGLLRKKLPGEQYLLLFMVLYHL